MVVHPKGCGSTLHGTPIGAPHSVELDSSPRRSRRLARSAACSGRPGQRVARVGGRSPGKCYALPRQSTAEGAREKRVGGGWLRRVRCGTDSQPAGAGWDG